MGPQKQNDSEDSRLQSAPRPINIQVSVSDTCTSSSYSSSPLWPQSFGRTMGVYSRSTSRRGRPDLGVDGLTTAGLGATFSEQLADALAKAEYDLKKPLLGDSMPNDVEKGDYSTNTLRTGLENVKLSRCRSSHLSGDVDIKNDGQHIDEVHSNGSSFIQALFNGMNVLAGVGILSTPYATAQGGWLGLSFLFAFAFICCYTAILLRRCLDSDAYISSYPDVGEASFGKWGRWIISVMLYLELFAVAIEFLILEGDNLAQLFPTASLTIGGIVLHPQTLFVILSAFCMLPTVWLRELSFLSYVSAGGVFASVLIVLAVGWIGLLDGVGFHHQGSLLHLTGLPVAAGLYSFCYCGHAVFPSIYDSMQDRKQFSHVLVICFFMCTLLYGGVAVMGYSMFGDDLQSQITLNLPRELPASHIAIWVTLINPFAKYALTIMPLAVALEEFLPHSVVSSRKNIIFWGTIVRTLLVISTVAVAITLPFFGLLMAFIGSFLSIAVSIHVPCVCYLRIFGWRLSRWEVSLVVFVVFIGLVAGVVGTYYSVKAILDGL